jgi:hypothetical protein
MADEAFELEELGITPRPLHLFLGRARLLTLLALFTWDVVKGCTIAPFVLGKEFAFRNHPLLNED